MASAPSAKTRVIIDADTANEIDDLFAIVRTLVAPEFLVEGVQSAPWSPATTPNDTVEQSQALNEAILEKMGLSDEVPAPIGASHSLPDDTTPVDSPAARHIIERAHAGSPENKLLVFATGQCTNLASALLLDPTIVDKVTFAFLNGDYRDGKWGPGIYNWKNDIRAVRVLFESSVEYFHMPAPSVSGEIRIAKATGIERLEGRGGVFDLLLERWLTFPPAQKHDPWTMWDIALVEAFLRPHLAVPKVTGAPIIHDVDEVETVPENPRKITVFERIDAAAMEADFWEAIETYRRTGERAATLGRAT